VKTEIKTVFVICTGFDHFPMDVALTLEGAKRRAFEYIRPTPLEVEWGITNGGWLAAYSLDHEEVFVVIEQYNIELWQVLMRDEINS